MKFRTPGLPHELPVIWAAPLLLAVVANAQFAPAPGSPFALGTNTGLLGVADLNGDGISDVVVNDSSGNVTVFLGDGAGRFSPAPAGPFAAGPSLYTIGDFNGDGKPDVAIVNTSVTVILGNGSGGFSAASGSSPQLGINLFSVAVGDFNGDGKLDLAVANSGDLTMANAGHYVSVLLGNGSGGFTDAPGSPFAVGAQIPSAVSVGDFNRDGKPDIAVGFFGTDAPMVLLGIGSGGFSVLGNPVGSDLGRVVAIAVADFNGDGILDLATAYFGHAVGVVRVWLGDGSGGFNLAPPSPPSPAQFLYNPLSIAAADFDGDGNQDLVFSNEGPLVRVLLGDGSGRFTEADGSPFQAGSPINVSSNPGIAVVGDFNGDGRPDIVTNNQQGNSLTVLLNSLPLITANPASLTFYAATGQAAPPGIPVTVNSTSAGSTYSATSNQPWLSASPASNATGSPTKVTVSARQSSLTAGSFSGTVRYSAPNFFGAKTNVTLNVATPAGTLTEALGSPFGTGVSSVTVGDFNGDGKPDLVAANTTNNTITVLLGNGSGEFNAALGSPFAAPLIPAACIYGMGFSLTVGDFNGDGKSDLAITSPCNGSITVLLSNGSGTFRAAPGSPFVFGDLHQPASYGTLNPDSVVARDFNGDGNLDLAVTFFNTQGAVVLLGNGSGGFTPPLGNLAYPGVLFASWLAVGDFNGDGIQDLVVTTPPPSFSHVSVLLGNNSGLFGLVPSYSSPIGNFYFPTIVGDFNGDGNQDIVLTENEFPQGPGTVGVLLGNGAGGFTPTTGVPLAFRINSVVAGDFNGDGKPDLAVTGFDTDGGVTVLLGNGLGGFSVVPGNPITVPGGVIAIAVADFNGDGAQDLAVVTGNNNVVVLLGGLAATSSALSTSSPSTITLGTAVPLTLAVSDAVTAFNGPIGSATFLDGSAVLGIASQTASPYTFTASNLATGTHILTATYGGDTRSLASQSDSITIQVNPASQIITFGHLNEVTFGVAPFAISATASSSLPVVFTSTTLTVCTVNGNLVGIVGSGTCSITASQGGNTNYNAAPSVTRTFSVVGQPVPDDFNGTTLNTNLWTFVNPAGDGSYSLNGSELLLNVPAGPSHDPAFGGADKSARVVQSISNTDFQVEVKFDSIPSLRYQFEGILVERDAGNFLRFEFGSDGSSLVISADTILSRVETSQFSNNISVPAGTASLWLRVRRAGSTWTVTWSADGTTYLSGGLFKQALIVAVIGPFAGNYKDSSGAAPAFTAKVDYFAAGVFAPQFVQQGGRLVGTGLSRRRSVALVGGPSGSFTEGAAWVFSNGRWTPQGSKLVGAGYEGNATQGTSVALSADGNTALVGGPFRFLNFDAAYRQARRAAFS